MKILKLATASALALSVAGIVSAQETVNVAGSTAFRTYVTEAEVAVASHNAAGAATNADVAYVGSSAFAANGSCGATSSIVHGYLTDHTEVYFRNYWTGSLAGVVDLSVGTSDPYIPPRRPVQITRVAARRILGAWTPRRQTWP